MRWPTCHADWEEQFHAQDTTEDRLRAMQQLTGLKSLRLYTLDACGPWIPPMAHFTGITHMSLSRCLYDTQVKWVAVHDGSAYGSDLVRPRLMDIWRLPDWRAGALQREGSQGWQGMFGGCGSTLGSLSLQVGVSAGQMHEPEDVIEQMQWRGAGLLNSIREGLPGLTSLNLRQKVFTFFTFPESERNFLDRCLLPRLAS